MVTLWKARLFHSSDTFLTESDRRAGAHPPKRFIGGFDTPIIDALSRRGVWWQSAWMATSTADWDRRSTEKLLHRLIWGCSSCTSRPASFCVYSRDAWMSKGTCLLRASLVSTSSSDVLLPTKLIDDQKVGLSRTTSRRQRHIWDTSFEICRSSPMPSSTMRQILCGARPVRNCKALCSRWRYF